MPMRGPRHPWPPCQPWLPCQPPPCHPPPWPPPLCPPCHAYPGPALAKSSAANMTIMPIHFCGVPIVITCLTLPCAYPVRHRMPLYGDRCMGNASGIHYDWRPISQGIDLMLSILSHGVPGMATTGPHALLKCAGSAGSCEVAHLTGREARAGASKRRPELRRKPKRWRWVRENTHRNSAEDHSYTTIF
jgi:hypothetical protein